VTHYSTLWKKNGLEAHSNTSMQQES